jgi:hypothetical protein
MIGRVLAVLALLGATMAVLGVSAQAASAQEVCKTYNSLTLPGHAPRAGTACVANADDFPSFIGYAHVGNFSIQGRCNGMLVPDIDEPPLDRTGCAPIPDFTVWKWTGAGWQRESLTAAEGPSYVYPFGPGWRWAWSKRLGWVAAPSSGVLIHWWVN